MAIRLSHQTERNTSHVSLRTEDICSDIVQRGFYTITISDNIRKDDHVTIKVKDGQLANCECTTCNNVIFIFQTLLLLFILYENYFLQLSTEVNCETLQAEKGRK